MKHNNYKTRAGRRARSRLARVLTMLALLLCVGTGAWVQTESNIITWNAEAKTATLTNGMPTGRYSFSTSTISSTTSSRLVPTG